MQSPVTGWRCAVCGAHTPIGHALSWRCPNATEADRRHAPQIVQEMAPLRSSGAANPFLAFRRYLAWDAFAEALGMSVDQRDAQVTELDSLVAGVAGTGFHTTPFERADALSDALGFHADGGVWVKDETGQVAGSHKARHLFGILLHVVTAERAGLAPWSRPADRPPLAIASCGNAAFAASTLAAALQWPIRVFVPPTATAPEVESALQAIGQVDAIVIGLFEQGCIAAYDALKNIGVDATVTPIVAVSPCHGAAMQQHMADAGESGILPNGWYFSGNGYNPFVGDAASGEDTMIDVFAAAGKPEVAFAVGAEEVVGGTMTMVKHLNAAAGDYSFATLDAAIRGFTGPVMAAAGPMACGAPPVFKGICAGRSSISRYIDGKWEATREGDNAVDISPYVAPAG